MPSFDIVNRVDLQEIDNAVNNARKELATRFDFRGVVTEISLDRGKKILTVVSADEGKLTAVQEILHAHMVRRKVEPKCLEFKTPEPASGGRMRQEVAIREGVTKEAAQTVVKAVKAAKLKVQTAIQDEQVRVTGKKIDDLQEVIRLVKELDLPVPVQFINMKS